MWTYKQTTGELFHDGTLIATGYSGHEAGVNNPAMENVKRIGPMPRGAYTIGPAYNHPNLGSICMDLHPQPSTETFGRGSFRIHADSVEQFGKKEASHGCLIFAKPERQLISDSPDKDLEVIL